MSLLFFFYSYCFILFLNLFLGFYDFMQIKRMNRIKVMVHVFFKTQRFPIKIFNGVIVFFRVMRRINAQENPNRARSNLYFFLRRSQNPNKLDQKRFSETFYRITNPYSIDFFSSSSLNNQIGFIAFQDEVMN
jgi:hypothetical protein